MVKLKLSLALVALAVGLIASPLAADSAARDVVTDWAVTDNLTALGYSPRVVPIDNDVPGSGSLQLRPRVPGRHGRAGHVRRLPAHRREVPVAA